MLKSILPYIVDILKPFLFDYIKHLSMADEVVLTFQRKHLSIADEVYLQFLEEAAA